MASKGQKYDENLKEVIIELLKQGHLYRELARNIICQKVQFLHGNNNFIKVLKKLHLDLGHLQDLKLG